MATEDKRQLFLPLISQCFAEHGYRGTTTAKFAELCGVRENVLYRIWPSKKAMFIECIEFIFDATMKIWSDLSPGPGGKTTAAEQILDFQARDHGEMRHYRIIFAGLMEDDADIRKKLRELYRRFHEFLSATAADHRDQRDVKSSLDTALAVWAIMGVGAMADIQRELRILPGREREDFLRDACSHLLNQD